MCLCPAQRGTGLEPLDPAATHWAGTLWARRAKAGSQGTESALRVSVARRCWGWAVFHYIARVQAQDVAQEAGILRKGFRRHHNYDYNRHYRKSVKGQSGKEESEREH